MNAGADWEKGTASLCPLSMWPPLARWTSTSGLSCATSRSASCRCTWPRYPLYCCIIIVVIILIIIIKLIIILITIMIITINSLSSSS